MNAFFIAPAVRGLSLRTLTSTHPSLEQRLDQLARIAAELGPPARRRHRCPDAERWVSGTCSAGGSATKRPNLDNLFAVPGAAVTLQTAVGLSPTGIGSVCFRSAEGVAAANTEAEVVGWIEADGGPKVERSVDSFGFTWLVVRSTPDDVSGLVTDLHAVNTGLEMQGFASGLLCSIVGFSAADHGGWGWCTCTSRAPSTRSAPTARKTRDSLLERQVRDQLGSDLTIEPDLSRWMPVWGAPGL